MLSPKQETYHNKQKENKMEKIEEVAVAVEHDTPEVRRNKELMDNFDHGEAVYRKGKKAFDTMCKVEEMRREAGLAPEPSKVVFTHDENDYKYGTMPDPDDLNRMYKDMTYEKALNFLQSYLNMMTDDKNNKNGLNFLNSLPSHFLSVCVSLALLRIEEWNHAHRALAGRVALAVVDEDENKKTSPEPQKQTKLKSVLAEASEGRQVQELEEASERRQVQEYARKRKMMTL